MAFMIWLAEKEFNVGAVTSEFPLMKLVNMFNEDNVKRYNEMNKTGVDKGSEMPKTMR